MLLFFLHRGGGGGGGMRLRTNWLEVHTVYEYIDPVYNYPSL